MHGMSQPPVPHPVRAGAKASSEPHRWSSAELLRGQPQVLIEHRGAVYTLRVTALGKLILTK